MERQCQLTAMWEENKKQKTKPRKGQAGDHRLPSLHTTILWGCTLWGSMRACVTKLCDSDSVRLSRSLWSGCPTLFSSRQVTLHLIIITVPQALQFVVDKIKLSVPENTEPIIAQYAEMDCPDSTDLFSVFVVVGTHLLISWTADLSPRLQY